MKWTLLLVSNAEAGPTTVAQLTANLIFEEEERAKTAAALVQETINVAAVKGLRVLITRIE